MWAPMSRCQVPFSTPTTPRPPLPHRLGLRQPGAAQSGVRRWASCSAGSSGGPMARGVGLLRMRPCSQPWLFDDKTSRDDRQERGNRVSLGGLDQPVRQVQREAVLVCVQTHVWDGRGVLARGRWRTSVHRMRPATARRIAGVRAAALLVGIVLSVGLSACGDDPQYQLLVVNRFAGDVIVVAAGQGYDAHGDTMISHPAYPVGASLVVVTSPIQVGWHDDGSLDTLVTVFATSCRRLGSIAVGAGERMLVIGADGELAAGDVAGDAPAPTATLEPTRSPCGPP